MHWENGRGTRRSFFLLRVGLSGYVKNQIETRPLFGAFSFLTTMHGRTRAFGRIAYM